MIKLAYQEYDYKMSLAAMRQFKEATGKDLWHTLLSLIEAQADEIEKKSSTLQLLAALSGVVDFDTGAEIFHSLLTDRGGKVRKDDIEDAMFRVGWLPSKTEDGMTEPYPLVILQIAVGVNAQMQKRVQKKKS